MLIFTNETIDWEKWDALLTKSNAEIFNFSFYIQAISQMQILLVDETWENGIVFSYKQKLAIKQIYTPPFGRQTDFIGTNQAFQKEVISYIQTNFKTADFGSASVFESLVPTPTVHQVIQEKTKLNTLAKRMLKKAERAAIEVREIKEFSEILPIISSEIGQKVKEINSESIQLLSKLCSNLQANKCLKIFGIYQNKQLEGGQIFMDTTTKRIYLKGACLQESKKNGAMYSCMNQAIETAFATHKSFDFGGSNVPGVKQFNLNFGAIDQTYFRYNWNKAGLVFKSLQFIKKKIKP